MLNIHDWKSLADELSFRHLDATGGIRPEIERIGSPIDEKFKTIEEFYLTCTKEQLIEIITYRTKESQVKDGIFFNLYWYAKGVEFNTSKGEK